ncbi:hypothetical protein MJ560_22130 [Klebsiella pneumoniae]|nr:hypothetical protein MJ560_22130 [Klebsiella pneumoniae]
MTFLGAPRTKEAEYASFAPWLMTLSVVLAAVFCLVGGIAALYTLPLVSGVFPVQARCIERGVAADDRAAAYRLPAAAAPC